MISHFFSFHLTPFRLLVLLPPEAAALGEPGPAPSRLTEDSGTAGTHHHSLGVTEHSGDPDREGGVVEGDYCQLLISPVTARTLDVHEVAVGVLDQSLQLVFPV